MYSVTNFKVSILLSFGGTCPNDKCKIKYCTKLAHSIQAKHWSLGKLTNVQIVSTLSLHQWSIATLKKVSLCPLVLLTVQSERSRSKMKEGAFKLICAETGTLPHRPSLITDSDRISIQFRRPSLVAPSSSLVRLQSVALIYMFFRSTNTCSKW